MLHRSGLAARRPVDDVPRIETMLRNTNLTVTTRAAADFLIGVSLCITDSAYCCHCSDLAVDEARQGQGISRELLRRSHEMAGLGTSFHLLSSLDAIPYYPKNRLQKIRKLLRRAAAGDDGVNPSPALHDCIRHPTMSKMLLPKDTPGHE